jgi:hypothetical protein
VRPLNIFNSGGGGKHVIVIEHATQREYGLDIGVEYGFGRDNWGGFARLYCGCKVVNVLFVGLMIQAP